MTSTAVTKERIAMGVAEQIRQSFTTNLPGIPETQIDQMVEFELQGIGASERVSDGWCRCPSSDGATSYYRKASGYHGWFHDPALGGCGGITQTG